jgi:hypothetical protein
MKRLCDDKHNRFHVPSVLRNDRTNRLARRQAMRYDWEQGDIHRLCSEPVHGDGKRPIDLSYHQVQNICNHDNVV